MKKIHNPPSLGSPATYSNGIEVPATARTLYIAGQVGWDANGVIKPGIAEQTKLAFANMRAVLQSAGMDFQNIVKTTVFMTHPEQYPEFSRVRTSIIGDVKPASTLIFITQLLKPELLVEIEAVAVAD